ncbi:MAG: ATP-dependent DNA helicase RecG [Frankiaceae bacterium]
MTDLDEPLRATLGKAAAELERAFGFRTVEDLLAHYPRRYAERGQLTALDGLKIDEHVTVLAKVARVSRRPMKQRKGEIVEAQVTDGSGFLTLTFFKQGWRANHLRPGRQGLFAGKVSVYGHKRQLTHPTYLLLDSDGDDPDAVAAAAEFSGALIPVYPATAAVSSWEIARCVSLILPFLSIADDPLPAQVRERERLLDRDAALRAIHRPQSRAEVARAETRLAWDEAFVLQATLAQRRQAAQAFPAVPRPTRPDGLLAAFDARLPFTLTAGQCEVADVLTKELARPHPMHRLLQGEVGAGKTVVALRAMLTVVDSGGQAALLAPTEVLASQHARSIRALLGPLAVAGELGAAAGATRVSLLTGSMPAAARRAALAETASGEAGIVIGTHALLQEGVNFAQLGLLVVDEQHRFGVEQRDTLRAKGSTPPHVLVMTATPIPRTVAMTVYGDLETSTLRELPAGRSPVSSFVVPGDNPGWTERMWGRVRDEVAAGHQAYVVCPRIGDDGSSADGAAEELADVDASPERRPSAAVLEVAPALANGPLRDLRLGVLHGRLPPEEKEAVMAEFAAGRLDVLVATTVIEVGVDVANATVMVVLDADRFGVSQLHQLRGRVGRGNAPGWCLLHSAAETGPAVERLGAVAATTDGFELARVDLEQRREGNVVGAEQSGRRSGLKMLSLLRDEPIIRQAREDATAVVAVDPTLAGSPGLARAVARLATAAQAQYLEKT